jgi:sec-independent protein translocase protein TatC
VSSLPIDPDTARAGQSLLKAVLELRSRAVKAIGLLLVLFLALLPFADEVFQIISQPIQAALPEGSSLISKTVASPFMTPMKATFWVALFIAMPLVLYQAWKLMDAWLPADKRRVAPAFMVASAVLFYLGVAFAFFLVLPLVFEFFASRLS